MFDGFSQDCRHTGGPYRNRITAHNIAVLELQRVTLNDPASQNLSFTIGLQNPYRPAFHNAQTWQGKVMMLELEEIGCGGTSILNAMALGYLPTTPWFKGPVVV